MSQCVKCKQMGQKLNPQDNELYKRTDEVLHYIWDPIGVGGEPYARDEYWSYLPNVYALVKEGNRAGIVEYLAKVVVERMGFSSIKEQRKHAEGIADLLLRWKEKIFNEDT